MNPLTFKSRDYFVPLRVLVWVNKPSVCGGPVQVISEVVKSTWVNYLVLLGLLSTHGAGRGHMGLSCLSPLWSRPILSLRPWHPHHGHRCHLFGQKSVKEPFGTRKVFRTFRMHLLSGLKMHCLRFHCSWHKLMDFRIKICQYIWASRRSKNIRQIKNLCTDI